MRQRGPRDWVVAATFVLACCIILVFFLVALLEIGSGEGVLE